MKNKFVFTKVLTFVLVCFFCISPAISATWYRITEVDFGTGSDPNVLKYIAGVNDAGQVVGWCDYREPVQTNISLYSKGFLWENGSVTEIVTNNKYTSARAINNVGQVVVGIGTTSPVAKLDVAGDINVASDYKIDGNTVLSVAGTENTFIGDGAGAANTTGHDNTFSGYGAGYSNTWESYNTFSGVNAGYSNNGGHDNTCLGASAGYSNTTGVSNTFSGVYAGYKNTTGWSNTFSGMNAGCSNTTGFQNTFSGIGAGGYNTTGSYNTFSGYEAGYSNTTGSGNVFLGYRAGTNETGSNKLYIDNSNTSTPLIYGDFSTNQVGINRVPTANTFEVGGDASKTTAGGWLANSDARIKTDVQTVTGALETLDKVRLVSFKYTDNYRNEHSGVEGRPYLNVIAQEFQEVFPDYVKSSGEKLPSGDEILQVDTYPLTVYSAAAIQELHRIANEKDAEIAQLKDRVSKMEAQIAKLSLKQEGGVK